MVTTTAPDSLAAPISGLEKLEAIKLGNQCPHEAFAEFAENHAAKEDALKCFVEADFRTTGHRTDGPLMGLPVGIKDIIDTADFPTRHGSPIYQDNQTLADAPCVTMTRNAGGAVVGKTVTTEFAYFTPRGTKNPWNQDYSPGGSSSGSAAGVASGMLAFAIGTQTGGSVVRPASYCGISGYKPTFGLIPSHGVKPFSSSLDTVGVFGATAADCAFFAGQLCGRPLDVPSEVKPPVYGVCRTSQWEHACAEMQDAIDLAVERATAAGARVVERDLPSIFARAADAHAIIQNYEAVRLLAWEWMNRRDELSPKLVETLEEGEGISAEGYDAARRVAKAARLALMTAMADIDVLLTPSAASIAPKDLNSTGSPTFNKLWTLMGVPCVNVPGIFSSEALPLGVQVVGPALGDRQTLAAAQFLQNALAA
ncbi:amidase [Tepidamorphus sp. 3E244]|uniref:amidase n=1 Tax=Tepidamorphus sp. 3E244 TaxID=3385498 RepID=UPI0038FC3DAE